MPKLDFDNHEPCKNCPYRKDAPRHFWSPEEFQSVLRSENTEYGFGNLFACHKDAKRETRRVCAGWLLDQKNRGIPNLNLRLHLMHHREDHKHMDALSDGGHEMFSSIQEMCRANGIDVEDPPTEEEKYAMLAAKMTGTRKRKKRTKP